MVIFNNECTQHQRNASIVQNLIILAHSPTTDKNGRKGELIAI